MPRVVGSHHRPAQRAYCVICVILCYLCRWRVFAGNSGAQSIKFLGQQKDEQCTFDFKNIDAQLLQIHSTHEIPHVLPCSRLCNFGRSTSKNLLTLILPYTQVLSSCENAMHASRIHFILMKSNF